MKFSLDCGGYFCGGDRKEPRVKHGHAGMDMPGDGSKLQQLTSDSAMFDSVQSKAHSQ